MGTPNDCSPSTNLTGMLDAFKAGEQVETHTLDGAAQSWTLGRGGDQHVDILLKHESISRRHAMINRRDGCVFLTDLGSAHGTRVDKRKIAKHTPVKLVSGSRIAFGASSRTYIFREEQK